nr:DUF2798 domain-containing protein [Sulfurospirillum sp. MES]
MISFFMTLLMSFVITLINVGLIDGFGMKWFQAFWRAYVVAFPAVLTVVPIVRKIVNKVVAKH